LAAFCALWGEAPNAPFPFPEDTMTTPRTRSLVSVAAALTLTLALGGCASAPARLALDHPAPVEGRGATIRFDNEARQYVHVYLVGQQREWLLGRVEPGARATLRIPDEALLDGQFSVRLAVLAGTRATLRAASEPRAAVTISYPPEELLAQRWTFSQTLADGQATALLLGRVRPEISRQ
jgi:hypothetical protein